MSMYDDPSQAWARISGDAIQIDKLAAERDMWQEIAHHFYDQLVDRWHNATEPVGTLDSFAGLTIAQHDAWVEGRYDEVLEQDEENA